MRSLHSLFTLNLWGWLNLGSMEIFFSDELRARMLNLKKNEFTKDAIRRIYLEETGREIPAQMTLYHSEDYMNNFFKHKNVFDASIIHLFNEKSGINQVYYIIRGDFPKDGHSASKEKWLNLFTGIFVGKNNYEFHIADKFKNTIIQQIEERTKESHVSLVKIGLGYGLGGNTIQLLQFLTGDFDKVYTVNAVPTTLYQLAFIDSDFCQRLFYEFNLQTNDFDHLYTINPKMLEEFAEKYYNKKAQNMIHIVTEGNIFQSLTAIRGFFQIGKVQSIPSSININPLPELIGKIPDVLWKDLQVFLASYSDFENQVSETGFAKIVTGLDLSLLDQVISYDGWEDIINFEDVYSESSKMIQLMQTRLPLFLQLVEGTIQLIETKGDSIVKEGFISKKEFVSIMQELKDIKESLKKMENQTRFLSNTVLELDIASFKLLIKIFKNIKEEVKLITSKSKKVIVLSKPLHNSLRNSFHLLSLQNTIQLIATEKGKRYTKSGDLVVIQKQGDQSIRINVSSAIRIYLKGMEIYDEKEAILKRMKEIYLMEFVEDFEERKRKLLAKIEDMENRPWKYQYLVGNVSQNADYFYQLKKIHVHEEIYPLDASFQVVFENMFEYYEQEIAMGRERVNKIRKAIEDLFNTDDMVADSIKKAGYG